MTINPVSASQILQSITSTENTKAIKATEDFIPFGDILKDAIDNVVETETAVNEGAIKIATGDADALHTLTIDMAKADLALQTLVQIRNKALDAYNEIMRITL